MRKILLLVTASIVSSLCLGQVPNMEPSADLKKFDWMRGEWATTATWSMMGMQMQADMKVTVKWNGQFLRQEAVYSFDGLVTMTETMMFGYDPNKKEFFSSTYTNMAPLPRVERGKITGNALVMLSDPWSVMGAPTVSRSTLTKQGNDQFTIKVEFKEGDAWTTVTEAVFERKK